MRRKKKTNPSKGRVRNATPNEYNGIKFKSKLERYTYQKLIEAGFKPEYETEKIQLVEPFRHEGKAIRATSYNPDFIVKDYIIETKGYFTEVARLKWKMFLRWMYDRNYIFNNKKYKPILLMSIKQIDEFVEQLIQETNG